MSLIHRPLYSIPTDRIEMQCFQTNWLMIMGAYDSHQEITPLELILSNMIGKINQRRAYVCASFIVWLGTNLGNSLYQSVVRINESHREIKFNVWAAAWHEHNKRELHVNGGIRAIEFILAPDDHYKGNRLAKRPELSVDDLETIDNLLEWLDSQSGYLFIAMVRKEIEFKHHTQKKG